METLNKRLKLLREEKGISQKELGNILSFNQATIAKWEAGSRNPDNDTLIKIAKFFKVSTDYLLGLED